MEDFGEVIAYPTVQQICEANRRLIEHKEFGGLFMEPANMLNPDALFYILNAVQSSIDGIPVYLTLKEKAGAMAYHIISRHVFYDGNKRTGLYVAWMFLRANGIEIHFDKSEVELARVIANKEATQEDLLQWLHNHQTE